MAKFPSLRCFGSTRGLQKVMIAVLFLQLTACSPNPHHDPNQNIPSNSATHPSRAAGKKRPNGPVPDTESVDTLSEAPAKNGASTKSERVLVPPTATPKSDRALQSGGSISINKLPKINSRASLNKTDFVIQGAPKRRLVRPVSAPVKKEVLPEAQAKIDAQQRQLDALKRAGQGSKTKSTP